MHRRSKRGPVGPTLEEHLAGVLKTLDIDMARDVVSIEYASNFFLVTIRAGAPYPTRRYQVLRRVGDDIIAFSVKALTQEQKYQMIHNLLEEGRWSSAKVARIFGVSAASISYHSKRHRP